MVCQELAQFLTISQADAKVAAPCLTLISVVWLLLLIYLATTGRELENETVFVLEGRHFWGTGSSPQAGSNQPSGEVKGSIFLQV